jgi:PIN domain nuclease of toxin-antitoxin system
VILLDTHALIWWVEGNSRLSRGAAATILAQSPALVSPISFWELVVLVERGRVAVDRDIHIWCRDLLATGNVKVAALTPSAAVSAARLPEFHGDPADRFIYATALELGINLVSKDARIRDYARTRGDIEAVW